MNLDLTVGDFKTPGSHHLATLIGDEANESTTINNVRELNQTEVESYLEAEKSLKRWIARPNDAFKLLTYAYKDLINVIEQVRSESRSQKLFDGAEQLLRINSELLSYLSMAKLYIDHTCTMITSAEVNMLSSFNTLRSEAFDDEFAYRFFENIRNFGQHNGIPLSGLHAGGSLNRETGEIRYSFQLYFDRDFLLAERDTWSAGVRTELEAKPSRMPAEAVIKAHFARIKLLHESALKLFKPKIEESYLLMSGYRDQTRNSEGTACVAKLRFNGSPVSKTSVGLRYIPLRLLDLVASIS